MKRPHTLILLLLVLTCFQGCSTKSRPVTDSTTAQASALSLSEKGKLAEERIVNGEVVSEGDLQGLASTELRILRNASFARHGRKYDSPGLGDYFGGRSWYRPRDDYNDTLLTASDRANVKLIAAAEQTASTSTIPNPEGQTASSNPTPPLTPPGATTPESGGGQLTTEKVQRAVDMVLDWTRKGGRATVLGVQELPRENAARADIQFDGFQYNADLQGSPVSKDKKTPPSPDINDPKFSEKRLRLATEGTRVVRFSGRGVGILKHFNDGRWVLTAVHFDFVGLTGNIEIR
jgi:YARHG domain